MKKQRVIIFTPILLVWLVMCMANIVYPSSVDLNLRRLNSVDTDTRKEAAKDLKYYGTKKVVKALKNSLGDPNADVRKEAANSLGYIGDNSAVDSLIFVLNDSDMGVRGAAAKALGKIADPKAIHPLERLAEKDWNPIIKNIAGEAAQNCRLAKYRMQSQTESAPAKKKPSAEKTTVSPQSAVAEKQVVPVPQAIPAHKPKIAVLDFDDVPAQKDAVYGRIVSDMVSTALIESNQFDVIDRAQAKKTIEEKNISAGESLDSAGAVELGKILGVQYLITGNVAKLGDLFETDVKMTATIDGKAVTAQNASAKGEENLRQMSKTISDGLVEKYSALPKSSEQDNTQKDNN